MERGEGRKMTDSKKGPQEEGEEGFHRRSLPLSLPLASFSLLSLSPSLSPTCGVGPVVTFLTSPGILKALKAGLRAESSNSTQPRAHMSVL